MVFEIFAKKSQLQLKMCTKRNTMSVKSMIDFFETNFKIFQDANFSLTGIIVRDMDGFEYRLPRPIDHGVRKSYKIIIHTSNFRSMHNGIEATLMCQMDKLERAKARVVTAAMSKLNEQEYDFDRMFAGEMGKTVTFAPSLEFIQKTPNNQINIQKF